MSNRGRGRGRGRAKSLIPSSDQLCLTSVEKVPPKPYSSSLYPPLDHFPAILSSDREYEEEIAIKNKLMSRFQSSNYYLKSENRNLLFSSQGEPMPVKKSSLNFNWDYFPLELRQTGKRKLNHEILESLRKNKMPSEDLTKWFDKLEQKEKEVMDVIKDDGDSLKKVKDEPEELAEEEEFDDEELDDDYNSNYFDNGEGYLDENDDLDEGPCY